jgi:hypothetical protein
MNQSFPAGNYTSLVKFTPQDYFTRDECDLALVDFITKKYILQILVNLTPLIPLSFSRRGGKNCREGAKPPLLFTLPLPLQKGKGDTGG